MSAEFGIKNTAPNSEFRIPHSELRTEAGGTPAFQSAPLRGNCRLSATPTGTVWNINAFHAPTVGEYADATTWQSVAHLTITNAKKTCVVQQGRCPTL
jgi:hypothetical protein